MLFCIMLKLIKAKMGGTTATSSHVLDEVAFFV